MTQELVVTRGLPASGKTTWAQAWVADDPTRYARVSRDDLRAMLFGVTDDLCPHDSGAWLPPRTRYQPYFAAPDLHVRESAVTFAPDARMIPAQRRVVVPDFTNTPSAVARASARVVSFVQAADSSKANVPALS